MPAHDAMAHMLVQHAERNTIQRSPRGRDLSQDIHAVAVFLDHPRDTTHLTLRARESLEQLILGCGVAARGISVFHRHIV